MWKLPNLIAKVNKLNTNNTNVREASQTEDKITVSADEEMKDAEPEHKTDTITSYNTNQSTKSNKSKLNKKRKLSK